MLKSLANFPRHHKILTLLVLLIGLGFALDIIATLKAESFWFQEIGYLEVFVKGLTNKLQLWLLTFLVSGVFLFLNIFLARKFRYPQPEEQERKYLTINSLPREATEKAATKTAFNLKILLPLLISLNLLVGLIVLHYSQIVAKFWQPGLSVLNVAPPLPFSLRLEILELANAILAKNAIIWQIAILIAIATILFINTEFILMAIALGLSLTFSTIIAGNWTRFLQYFAATNFNELDPLFQNDLSFYIFKFPIWKLLDFWLSGLFGYTFIACCLLYLVSGNSLSQGKFPGFSSPQLHHLQGLGSLMMFTEAFNHWLKRYELLYSLRGVAYGASYTDVKIQLPVETGLAVVAGGIAFWLLWRSLAKYSLSPSLYPAMGVLASYLIAFVLFAKLLPAIVQNLEVLPNELAREELYIQRSITNTRKAFGLDTIEAIQFNPQAGLNAKDITENSLTVRDIRLWDTRPLLQTNRQLQQIRLYYRFPDADIDRYTLKVGEEEDSTIPDTLRQQVIIAPRELDYKSVPQEAQTWVNKHLVYTHGYGFTLSPVNKVGEGGLPFYFVKDIGTGSEESEQGTLRTSDPYIRDSIPIGKPRIYYGQLTDNYVLTSTRIEELDYPSGDDNVYNTYDGRGGIDIGNYWQRIFFAAYLKDWQMLFTENFTPETKLLLRRDIKTRCQAIAPFLRFDHDPYLVNANVPEIGETDQENYLYWIIDAYTTSNRYPYSDPGKNKFNYIRNSVKIVVDAYNGDVDFYVVDKDDPIIQTWAKIFPQLFKPLEEMPETLFSHIRYPLDLFSTQSEQLLTYHMTDFQVFYNREDQWQIPKEIYGAESQPVEPYYLIVKLPELASEEFILLHPYTPTSRNNLVAWLAARSDGDNYGKLLLYEFPKQRLIYGPEQIEALINQDPVISQQISLWDNQGSNAIQGNLLMIPIEQSLIYVEPLYLEAEENSLPILARVIVVYENRIAMAETLEKALEVLFNPEQAENASPETIIREVENPTLLGPEP
ncbi:MAG: UPF0182 family protein [Spirulinaceae cyanobacterium]